MKKDIKKEMKFIESEMRDLIEYSRRDTEEAHEIADDLLLKALSMLGYDDLINLYNQVRKWYA